MNSTDDLNIRRNREAVSYQKSLICALLAVSAAVVSPIRGNSLPGYYDKSKCGVGFHHLAKNILKIEHKKREHTMSSYFVPSSCPFTLCRKKCEATNTFYDSFF